MAAPGTVVVPPAKIAAAIPGCLTTSYWTKINGGEALLGFAPAAPALGPAASTGKVAGSAKQQVLRLGSFAGTAVPIRLLKHPADRSSLTNMRHDALSGRIVIFAEELAARRRMQQKAHSASPNKHRHHGPSAPPSMGRSYTEAGARAGALPADCAATGMGAAAGGSGGSGAAGRAAPGPQHHMSASDFDDPSLISALLMGSHRVKAPVAVAADVGGAATPAAAAGAAAGNGGAAPPALRVSPCPAPAPVPAAASRRPAGAQSRLLADGGAGSGPEGGPEKVAAGSCSRRPSPSAEAAASAVRVRDTAADAGLLLPPSAPRTRIDTSPAAPAAAGGTGPAAWGAPALGRSSSGGSTRADGSSHEPAAARGSGASATRLPPISPSAAAAPADPGRLPLLPTSTSTSLLCAAASSSGAHSGKAEGRPLAAAPGAAAPCAAPVPAGKLPQQGAPSPLPHDARSMPPLGAPSRSSPGSSSGLLWRFLPALSFGKSRGVKAAAGGSA